MPHIELPHKVADYACPINGLEDQYEWKTGRRLPGYFLMDLSSIGFLYLKQKRAPAPRMVSWGNGMGKAQYDFLADIVGYQWACSENKSFRTAWQAAKESVGRGTPVIMGLLDMYHLPYFDKFYHRVHIPQHYVLLVGYDEQQDAALVQDNSLPGVQAVPLEDLRPAWDVHGPGQGLPNTFYTLQFREQPAMLRGIVYSGLAKRAQMFLNAQAGFAGLRGMRKAQAEVPLWTKELNEPQWLESLRFLATFTCSLVPNPPQRLLPYPLGYEDPHQAIRDRFASELAGLAQEFGERRWEQAAQVFEASGKQIDRDR